MLSLVSKDALPGKISGPEPPISDLQEDHEYEIERVIGKFWQNGEVHYIVRWKGYGPEDDWIIPVSRSNGFHNLVKEFHDLNPTEHCPAHRAAICEK